MQGSWYSFWVSCRDHNSGFLCEWLAWNRTVTELGQQSPSSFSSARSRIQGLIPSCLITPHQLSILWYLSLWCTVAALCCSVIHVINTIECLCPPHSQCPCQFVRAWGSPHSFHKVPPIFFWLLLVIAAHSQMMLKENLSMQPLMHISYGFSLSYEPHTNEGPWAKCCLLLWRLV